MTKLVRYIKVATIDQNGNDLTNTLESLTQITIPYPIDGKKVYKILGSAKFSTYYLLYVDIDNSPDARADPSSNATLNYTITGSYDTPTEGKSFVSLFSPTSLDLNGATSGSDTTPFLFENFVDLSLNKIQINTLPQKDISVSSDAFDIKIDTPGGLPVGPSNYCLTGSFGIIKSDPLFSNNVLVAGTTLSASGLTHPVAAQTATIAKEDITPGDIIYIGALLAAGPAKKGLNFTVFGDGKNTTELRIGSTAASGPTLENIVEPYLTRKFTNSDCDVLINNANQYQENPFLQDIDFSSGTIVPVNYNQIVSGSAQRATVPESMFTMGGMINPNNSAVNQVDRYNISGSSYFGQSSAGTFCVYYTTGSIAGSGGKSNSTFNISYIISNDEETFEITNSDLTLDFLRRLFGSAANPIQIGQNGGPLYPEPTQPIHTRAIAFRGTSNFQPMAFNGVVKIENNGSLIQMEISNTGSGTISIPQGGGIIYPSDIELTSAFDLPDRSRKILSKANILGPDSVE